MKTEYLLISIAVLVAITLITVIVTTNKTRKKNLKKQLDELYVRFNSVKTVPLAFKLNKAQAMARRNEEMAASVENYYAKYEETEGHINQIQDRLGDVDDSMNTVSYKEALQMLDDASKQLAECEKEVAEIDGFLEEFSKKENIQREYSSKLKEKYRVVKTTINKNAQLLSIAYEGFVSKLQECEELFSSSEEMMYSSDYGAAQDDLEKIDALLEEIKTNANAVPKLVKDTKGVLPLMLDETKRELALTRQRGVYIEHLDIENKLNEIETSLNADIKELSTANTEGIKTRVAAAKDELNDLNEKLAEENKAYKLTRETNDRALSHINDMEKVENYVRIAYDKDSARFGLENLNEVLKKMRESIERYKEKYQNINADLSDCIKPASEILEEAQTLDSDIDGDLKTLYCYKSTIDKSTDGETRAFSQLTKLQLVVSEVETKLAEYALPSIDESYKNDLKRSRKYIADIRELISQIPIDIAALNGLLDEAIDFIYKFYNNINNVVGMGIMVENAIVFGNKYRSTYPEIDRELSRAEFQYLNGEYTKALKTAISCMETLFPENADEKILENA
ncbi:MAG: septation ring formation regulator EzrA [Erysipelotrichaceae bacterium]|nr:septation ring formation regulator EzrA [Erysipelotrichaceae bacterium]